MRQRFSTPGRAASPPSMTSAAPPQTSNLRPALSRKIPMSSNKHVGQVLNLRPIFNRPAPALVILACMPFTACHREPTTAQASTTPPAAVETSACQMTDWPSGRDAVGTVRARTSAVLSSRLMGYVRDVRVHAGDQVRAGQVIAILDSRDLDVAYKQAQAARDESR